MQHHLLNVIVIHFYFVVSIVAPHHFLFVIVRCSCCRSAAFIHITTRYTWLRSCLHPAKGIKNLSSLTFFICQMCFSPTFIIQFRSFAFVSLCCIFIFRLRRSKIKRINGTEKKLDPLNSVFYVSLYQNQSHWTDKLFVGLSFIFHLGKSECWRCRFNVKLFVFSVSMSSVIFHIGCMRWKIFSNSINHYYEVIEHIVLLRPPPFPSLPHTHTHTSTCTKKIIYALHRSHDYIIDYDYTI